MSNNEFVLPDVGEGLTEAEIVNWTVKPGDTVHLNEVICEIETAKSLVEIPSPFEGVVAELLVEPGTTVPVGTPILRMQGDVAEGEAAAASDVADARAETETQAGQAAATPTPAPSDDDDEHSGAVLVGYGTGGPVKSRRRKTGQPPMVDVRASASEPQRAASSDEHEADRGATPGRPIAKPPVRKLAKDHGVNLTRISGSGPGGEILRDDVLSAASGASGAAVGEAGAAGRGAIHADRPPQPAFAGEREERIPVRGVRKLVAEAMVESKFSAPHTSVFVDVDATRTMEYVQRLKRSRDFEGLKVSPLLIMAKAITWAVRRNPEVNSAWAGDEIIRKNYVNLGIAASTPRGLVVPNIKDAQDLSLRDMAQAIETLTTRAREGLTQPAEMQHGTITITNVGVFGVDFGMPILNRGEAAIVAMGSITQKPWVVDGEVRPRMVTTVGGSFDHRVLDGDVISRFVADVASVLEEPALLLN